MKLFKRMLFVILIISVFVVTRLLIQDVKPLFKNLVDEAIANPLDKDFLTEEFEGLTIKYEKDDYASVETIKKLYPGAKEELDRLYGNNKDVLTLVLYKDQEEFKEAADSETIGGYYTSINNSIHMLSEKLVPKYEFEELFLHEYTHYRTNSYLVKHKISHESLPQWFNEGISEMIANRDANVNLPLEETIDFKELENNTDYNKDRKGNVDPYLQSFFTVNELVLQFGSEIISEVLLALRESDLSKVLYAVAGTNADELLTKYLERRENVKELVEQARAYEVNGDYGKALDVYQEILLLSPNNIDVKISMPHSLIKQSKFTEATTLLKKRENLEVYELQMLAELTLLSDLNDSLNYTEMSEGKIKTKIADDSFTSSFGDAIRNNLDDPVSTYLQLFKEDLITYQEIESQIKVNLKKMYPNDTRVQNL